MSQMLNCSWDLQSGRSVKQRVSNVLGDLKYISTFWTYVLCSLEEQELCNRSGSSLCYTWTNKRNLMFQNIYLSTVHVQVYTLYQKSEVSDASKSLISSLIGYQILFQKPSIGDTILMSQNSIHLQLWKVMLIASVDADRRFLIGQAKILSGKFLLYCRSQPLHYNF